MKINKTHILHALFYYLTFSGIAIAILYSLAKNFDWIVFKDGAVLLAGLTGVLLHLRSIPRTITLSATPVFLYTFVSLLLSDAPLFSKIASARQILMPFIFVALGYLLSTQDSYRHLLKTFFYCICIIIGFGIIERITSIWSIISIEEFFRSKNLPVFGNGYPVIFVEPISIFGYRDFEHGIFRMASLILDPINLGHILTCFIILFLFTKELPVTKNTKIASLTIAALCLALTLSKGAILQLFLSFALLKKKNKYIYALLTATIAAPLLFLYINTHSGFLIHLHGLMQISEHFTVLGHGLATFGNYSIMYNSESVSSLEGIADSFWSSLIGQIGLLGFLAWSIPIAIYCWMSRKNLPLSILVLTQVFVASLSENSFNFMSIAFALTLMGSYLRYERLIKLN